MCSKVEQADEDEKQFSLVNLATIRVNILKTTSRAAFGAQIDWQKRHSTAPDRGRIWRASISVYYATQPGAIRLIGLLPTSDRLVDFFAVALFFVSLNTPQE